MSKRELLSLPEHVNPNPNRTASAAYNFIPLPEIVVTAVDNAEELPDRDNFNNPKYPHTGYFIVELTTKSPLYVRCPLTLDQARKNDEGLDRYGKKINKQTKYADLIKNTPEFFYTNTPENPVIPGSSLRGMLRSLLEIVSYGKMQWIAEKKLFFRTVDDTALGRYYNEHMVEVLGEVQVGSHPKATCYKARVRGGFIRIQPNGEYVIEECEVARVEINDVLRTFGLREKRQLYELEGRTPNRGREENNPNQTPNWKYQNQKIWADVDAHEADYFFQRQYRRNGKLRHPDLYLRFRRARNLSKSNQATQRAGCLILTGQVSFKHLAFLFLPIDNPTILNVPNDAEDDDLNKRLIDRFQDDDQLTRWQKSAFPEDKPQRENRKKDGWLRDGEPVFFLANNGGSGSEIVFFGRAQMFRLPYENRPIDFVPSRLRTTEEIDYAEALFGYTKDSGEKKQRAYAGRVFFTDGIVTQMKDRLWLSDDQITPKILASPKPTAFQHYLVQGSDGKRNLKHYGSQPLVDQNSAETVIRGHKRYWFQGKREVSHIEENDPQWMVNSRVKETSSQHTQFRPVNEEITFTFRVYFENLSEKELGALCWILSPLGEKGKEYCHSLGMGKPIGLGAVKLKATLYLASRQNRYSTLFEGDDWKTGFSTQGELLEGGILEKRVRAFEDHIINALAPLDKPCRHLSDLKRIGMLLKMMEWESSPPKNRHQSLKLETFRDRRVLPDPSVFGILSGEGKPKKRK